MGFGEDVVKWIKSNDDDVSSHRFWSFPSIIAPSNLLDQTVQTDMPYTHVLFKLSNDGWLVFAFLNSNLHNSHYSV
ncbi:hypothetical protein RvY_09690 [Ramazzottius varieornatus]|uniref:Uncharacterized protein n=1 Tax=Ramazzottius varieornatus TaxID=947166 RepID=A0A1D1VA89_RAMVA|nr:hypothetical protein RvY_09690 [Ramazzottius varieornatus]